MNRDIYHLFIDRVELGELPFDDTSEFGDELSLTFEVESIDLGM